MLLLTHVCPATGFCRCCAFQIGKICCENCIVRNFQFRKFLFVNSYPIIPYIHLIKTSPCIFHKDPVKSNTKYGFEDLFLFKFSQFDFKFKQKG